VRGVSRQATFRIQVYQPPPTAPDEPPTGETTHPAIKDTFQNQIRRQEDTQLVGRPFGKLMKFSSDGLGAPTSISGTVLVAVSGAAELPLTATSDIPMTFSTRLDLEKYLNLQESEWL
jgi:hypothetical protein